MSRWIVAATHPGGETTIEVEAPTRMAALSIGAAALAEDLPGHVCATHAIPAAETGLASLPSTPQGEAAPAAHPWRPIRPVSRNPSRGPAGT